MTALSADPICREHLAGRPHPERQERFVLLCQTPGYLRTAQHDIESGHLFRSLT